MSATTARAMIQSMLYVPICDIVALRKRDINAGYPISLLTMVCIEMVSNIVYFRKKSSGDAVSEYFSDYMAKVRSMYGIEFIKKIPGKKDPHNRSTLVPTCISQRNIA